MPEIKVEKRKLMKINKKMGDKIYSQYLLTVPKSYAEQHNKDNIYVVANTIFIGAPDEKTLLKILHHLPEIENLTRKPEAEKQNG